MITIELILLYILTETATMDQFDFISSKAPTADFCDAETFHAECQVNEVIVMETARYGRMELGRCVGTAMGYVGCYRDVLGLADLRCSGRRICDIYVPNAEFEATRPCLKELKSYMEVSYVCVPIVKVTADYCHDNEELRVSGLTSGYLASVVTSDTPGCVGRAWWLEARHGQRINITLYDFTAGLRQPRDSGDMFSKRVRSGHDVTSGCREYAVLQDGERETVLCGAVGKGRLGTTFLSTGNKVKVTMKAGIGPTDMQRFIVHFKVVGCEDPVSTAGVIYRRISPVRAVGSCRRTPEKTWVIQCMESAWSDSTAEADNCSSGRMSQRRANYPGKNFVVHLATMIAAPTLLLALGTSLAVVVLQLKRKQGSSSINQGPETQEATSVLGITAGLHPFSQASPSSECKETDSSIHRLSPLSTADVIDISAAYFAPLEPATTGSAMESTDSPTWPTQNPMGLMQNPTGLSTSRQPAVTETLC